MGAEHHKLDSLKRVLVGVLMKPALRVLTTPLCLLTLLACPEQVVVRDIPAVCGDGAVDADEICDDGNNEQLDACTGVCQPARCGDGLTRTDLVLGDEAMGL